MRTRHLIGALLLFAAVAQTGASAQSPAQSPPQPKAYGPAGASCGAWLAGTPVTVTGTGGDGHRASYLLWTEGYVTGAAYALAGRDSVTIGATDEMGIQAYVTTYCTSHPLDSVLLAATQLFVELSHRSN